MHWLHGQLLIQLPYDPDHHGPHLILIGSPMAMQNIIKQ
jgi:hypothetical protein